MRKGGHIVAKEIKQDGAWKQWLRSHECKDITPGKALSIINFKQAFECSIQEVRRTLDKCFECPHTHHTKTSEGFVIAGMTPHHSHHPYILCHFANYVLCLLVVYISRVVEGFCWVCSAC